jgi:hypothetical protein
MVAHHPCHEIDDDEVIMRPHDRRRRTNQRRSATGDQAGTHPPEAPWPEKEKDRVRNKKLLRKNISTNATSTPAALQQLEKKPKYFTRAFLSVASRQQAKGLWSQKIRRE